MADDVENVSILQGGILLTDSVNEDGVFFQLVKNGLFTFGFAPCFDELVKTLKAATNLISCKGLYAFRFHRLAIFAQHTYNFMGDMNVLTANDILFMFLGVRWGCASTATSATSTTTAWRFWVTIKGRVFELGCCVAEVKNLQMPLTFILAKSCSSTYDLLKLSHRANLLIYDNESTSLAVNAC